MDLNGNTETSPGVGSDATAPRSIDPVAAGEPPAEVVAAPKARRTRALDLRWAASPRSARALDLERAARLALELGDQAARPLRKKEPAAEALACDLYRQSVACSLRALALVPSADSELESAPPSESPSDLRALLESAPPTLLARAAGGEEKLVPLQELLAQSTFRSLAALDSAEAARFARELAGFARALLSEVETREWRIERPGVMRWLKIAAVATLSVIAVIAAVVGPEKWEAAHDLAAGAPWRASSTYPSGCESPNQDCPSNPNFFFHTQEDENPWIEFDLGKLTSVSGVRVINRVDCCLDRAVPLVVSVSRDNQKWTEVARSTHSFSDWKTSFATTQARWVRLQVPKRTNLHFKRVRIFP